MEKPVGPYFLDILEKVTDTHMSVVIENHLEWTFTHHLGQLLTYATGCNTDCEETAGRRPPETARSTLPIDARTRPASSCRLGWRVAAHCGYGGLGVR